MFPRITMMCKTAYAKVLSWAVTSFSSGVSETYILLWGSDENTIFATVYGGYIYKTTDGGSTWTELTSAGARNWFGISGSGNVVYATTNGGYIYKTTDGGSTWTELTSAGARNWKPIACADSSVVYAAVYGGTGYIYKTTDGGSTWTELTETGIFAWLSLSVLGDSIYAGCHSNYMRKSTNGGASWTVVASLPRHLAWFAIVQISETEVVACANGDAIYRSSDGGESWTAITAALVKNWYSVSGSSSALYATEDGEAKRLYRSFDRGVSWELANESPELNGARSVFCTDGSYAYVATSDNKIYKGS